MNPKNLQDAENLCKKLIVVRTRIMQLSAGANGIRSIEIRVGGGSETFYCTGDKERLAEAGQFSTFELICDEDEVLKTLVLLNLQECEEAIKRRLILLGCDVPLPGST